MTINQLKEIVQASESNFESELFAEVLEKITPEVQDVDLLFILPYLPKIYANPLRQLAAWADGETYTDCEFECWVSEKVFKLPKHVKFEIQQAAGAASFLSGIAA